MDPMRWYCSQKKKSTNAPEVTRKQYTGMRMSPKESILISSRLSKKIYKEESMFAIKKRKLGLRDSSTLLARMVYKSNNPQLKSFLMISLETFDKRKSW